MSSSMAALRSRLQSDLLIARKARRIEETSAIRTLLAALANAEAVPLPPGPYREVSGRADVPRRSLGSAEIMAVIAAEVAERRRAVEELEARGLDAGAIRAELAILERYRDG